MLQEMRSVYYLGIENVRTPIVAGTFRTRHMQKQQALLNILVLPCAVVVRAAHEEHVQPGELADPVAVRGLVHDALHRAVARGRGGARPVPAEEGQVPDGPLAREVPEGGRRDVARTRQPALVPERNQTRDRQRAGRRAARESQVLLLYAVVYDARALLAFNYSHLQLLCEEVYPDATSTVLYVYSALLLEPRRPGDRVRHAVRHRQRAHVCPIKQSFIQLLCSSLHTLHN